MLLKTLCGLKISLSYEFSIHVLTYNQYLESLPTIKISDPNLLIPIAFLAMYSLSGSGDMEQNTEAQEENTEAEVENTEKDVEAGTQGVEEQQRCVADCRTVSQCEQFRTFLTVIGGASTHQVHSHFFFLNFEPLETRVQNKLFNFPSRPCQDQQETIQELSRFLTENKISLAARFCHGRKETVVKTVAENIPDLR